jgi:hypothetical protein
MPWHGHDALYCKVCGGHRDEVGPLSARYKCAGCGKRRQRENVDQIRAQKGPYFDAWRRGMYRATVEWLVDTGYIAEEEKQHVLDEFNERSKIILRYEPARAAGERTVTKRMGPDLPEIATARQRQVSDQLRRHYRRAHGDIGQGKFLIVMNMAMQMGMSREVAEQRAAKFVRLEHDDFTPLRV